MEDYYANTAARLDKKSIEVESTDIEKEKVVDRDNDGASNTETANIIKNVGNGTDILEIVLLLKEDWV